MPVSRRQQLAVRAEYGRRRGGLKARVEGAGFQGDEYGEVKEEVKFNYCETCRYCEPYGRDTDSCGMDHVMGRCHRRAPLEGSSDSDHYGLGAFPRYSLVLSDVDWCGEYERADDVMIENFKRGCNREGRIMIGEENDGL